MMRETHSTCQLQKLPFGTPAMSETSSLLVPPLCKLKIAFLKRFLLYGPSGKLGAPVKPPKALALCLLANYELSLSSSRLDEAP